MAIKLDKSAMVKNLVKRTKFVHHLDRVIGEGDFEWNFNYELKQDDTGWHPSSHCTPSLAELYHFAIDRSIDFSAQSTEAPEPRKEGFTASLYKTFMVGHFWHQYLQWITVHKLAMAKPEAIERRGTKGWGDSIVSGVHDGGKEVHHYADWHYVTGSGDIAPVCLPTHGECLVDFKTMGAFAFKPNLPSLDTLAKWECQMNIYMDFFDLERALVVGILKDSPHEFKEFEFRRNQDLIDALYGKWKLVSQCIEEKIEPPVDEEIELPLVGPIKP